MRVIVFFDLPMETSAQRREYNQFHRFLVKSGFIMMQKSVYSKLALNGTAAKVVMKSVRDHKPSDGIIQMLSVTEKQYARMEFVIGESSTNVLNSTDRLVIL